MIRHYSILLHDIPLTKYTPEKPYTHDPPIGVTLVPTATAQIL